MKAFVVSVVIVGVLAACNGDGATSVAAQAELAQHEAIWHQRDFHSYTFDFVQQQFGMTENLHVTVHADTVASVIDNDTGMPPTVPVHAPTIDELFGDANGAITNKALSVSLEFDDQLGYLTLYAVSAKVSTPAGPYSAKVSNLAAIE